MDNFEYGKLYLVNWRPGVIVVGRHVQTRGNDQEFPSFETVTAPDNFGANFSTHKDRVSGVIEENGHKDE